MGLRIHLTSFLCANIGVALLAVGIATNHWAGREGSNLYVCEGLWTECKTHYRPSQAETTKCEPLSDNKGLNPREYTAVVSLLFIACAFHVLTLITGLILFCKDFLILDKMLAVAELSSLVSAIIGLSIYATEYNSSYYGLKWSYALGWGACLCFFAALVFTIINIDRKKRDA